MGDADRNRRIASRGNSSSDQQGSEKSRPRSGPAPASPTREAKQRDRPRPTSSSTKARARAKASTAGSERTSRTTAGVDKLGDWLKARGVVFKAVGGILAAAAALVAILTPLGVIGGGDGDELKKVLRLAAARTFDAGTSRVEIHRQSPQGDFRIRGVVDYRRGVGRLVPEGFSPPATFIFDGDTTYLRRPSFRGGRWQRLIDFDEGPLPGISRLDPSQQLAYLNQLSDVSKVGEEPVFGVPTTHYAGRTELRDISEDPPLRLVPKERRERFARDWPKVRAALANLSWEVAAWVDAAGVVRRVAMMESSRETGSTVRTTVDLHDFGVKVDVRVPTKADPLTKADFGGVGP
jgi:hypothetical protein